MSVQTEIDRLASAKAAIKTAIEGKGVTVPDATLLDGMAALIEGIEAGGGNVITGEITLLGGNVTSLDLTPYGISVDNVPWARFLIEKPDIAINDTSHIMKRVLSLVQIVNDRTTHFSGQSCAYTFLYTSAGSASLSNDRGTAARFWDANLASTYGYDALTGRITSISACLYFYCPDKPTSSIYGLIPGRTYTWGVIL